MTDSGAQTQTTNKNTAAKPLAIIGIGCLFPQANGKDAYWANIKGAVDSITDVPETHWRPADLYDPDPKTPDHTYGKRGGFLDPIEFNPMEFSIQPNILEAIDTSQLLGLIAAREALRDAGYDPQSDFARDRVSVLLGVTGALEMVIPLGARLGHPQWRKALKDAGVPDDVAQEVVERIADSYVPWQENSFPGLLGNVVAGRISKQFDLGGTNTVVDAACGSSLSAVHMAAMELACGRSDMVITGGIDTFNDIFMYTCFSKTPALSPSNLVRPFDHQSDGTLIGEGLGLIALKRLEDAERDNDHIYAVIRGVGAASDGKGGAIYEPSASGQKRTLIDAYRQSQVDPRTISLLEAHGTGTKVGDATEIKALREVYGESNGSPWCALGSVKSQIGHTKAAAGSAGLIKTALALYHKILPSTINVEQPQAVITEGNSPFYVNTVTRPWLANPNHPRRAAVSAFGFGGSNFHCVLEEYLSEPTCCDFSDAPLLFALSGQDRSTLETALDQLASAPKDAVRRRAAQSRQAFNSNDPHRLLFVVDKPADLPGVIGKAKKVLTTQAPLNGTPQGIWYGQGPSQGKLAVLFPGQGAQYLQMLADLSCHAPQLLAQLQDGDDVLSLDDGTSLSSLIYPHSLFSSEQRQQAEQRLQATQHAQPAIGTVSFGAWNYLRNHYGLEAQAFAGHSYGELTALCAAGCYGSDDLLRLSHLRGTLMAGDGSDKGTMLAVSAPLDEIEQMIREENLCLVLANHNTPNQGVLSGEREEISRAETLCKQRKMRCTPLDVAAAFHSPLVAAASKPFHKALQEIDVQVPQCAVYANKTALTYPQEPGQITTLLAEQIASPVKFVRQIEQMYADGFTTFFEVGPGARLTGMVKKILADKEVQTIALDASNGKRSGLGDLAKALVQLAALGCSIDLSRWDDQFVTRMEKLPEPKPAKMTVTLTGANYVKEKPARPASKRHLVDADQIPTPTPVAQPTTQSVVSHASSDDVAALKSLQENMAVLQQMQEDTARLHQKFLEGQAAAVDTMRVLMDQQQPTMAATRPSTPPAAVPKAPQAPRMTAPQPSAARPVSQPAPQPSAEPGNSVQDALLDVVAEKTGYPQEMLELDMSLDADLGIDSIKRVEILSALQEAVPGLPAVQPEQLGSLETLRQIVEALGAVDLSAPQVVAAATAAASGSDTNVQTALLDVVAEKTGYPQEMLELDMSLDADLGIDSIKRVEILSALQEAVPGLPAVQPEQLGSLETLRQIVEALGAVDLSAPAQAVAAAPPAASGSATNVQAALLDVVAEKTGYPQEMLELDMSLDADLGIDSIKRVEILSALQEAVPGLPAVQPEQLGSLETLRQIVDALGATDTPQPPAAINQAPPSAPSASTTAKSVQEALIAVVADKTGYPQDMLELDMSLDADLGIDSIKRVEILSALQEAIPELPAVQPEQLGSLETLRQIVEALTQQAPGAEEQTATQTPVVTTETPAVPSPSQVSSQPVAPATVKESDPNATVRREVIQLDVVGQQRQPYTLSTNAPLWLVDDCSSLVPTLATTLKGEGYPVKIVSPTQTEVPDQLAGLVIIAPEIGTDSHFLRDAFSLVQRCAPALKKQSAQQSACLVTVSRLDGQCGFGSQSLLRDPLSGALAGLCKTARLEWPELTCKAIDVSDGLTEKELCTALIDELLLIGPIEIGINREGLTTPVLVDTPLPEDSDSIQMTGDDIVVISGGARGVTAEVATHLAQCGQPTLLLLGRSALPDVEPDWLAAAHTDADIKRTLMEHAEAPLKPRELNEQCTRVLQQRELTANLDRLRQAGSKVIYKALDIRDEKAVAEALDEARQQGTIRGIIHGAGVLADRKIIDKTLDQFDQVYSTKVAGLQALLHASESDPLRFIVLFSSSTGRFGRVGQVDYAMANEVLNKTAQALSRQKTDCRVLAINWGPWDGGMVTPALKKIFADEGIDVIDLAAGSRYLLQELNRQDGQVEIVILGDRKTPRDDDDEKAETSVDLSAGPITECYPELALTLQVSPQSMAVLQDHVIDGMAVVPTALIIEWMAHGAMHNYPGMQFIGFDNLRIFKGIRLTADEEYDVELRNQQGRFEEDLLRIPMQIVAANSKRVHASGDILLSSFRELTPPTITQVSVKRDQAQSHQQIYASGQLFHGTLLQGIQQITGEGPEGIVGVAESAPSPQQWVASPLRYDWLTDPMVLDSSFQMMILWCFAEKKQGSLPMFAGHYRQYRESFGTTPIHIQCRVVKQSGQVIEADIDFIDANTREVVARLEGYQCTMTPTLEQSFANNTLL
ncbi:SDR family NAD(P)-dependent oxidoreductase [uncultured Desulfuromonas sp.]|uniref:SDR family NAD(P)-dependent oxidoreductase n=1 Tax=uncultured Desulfuromonas sp. TaxID=181013 RepID=UPI002AAB7131|nr:SDR family NAD(P)-dependent oxidoreductase [uncultured Desulfuromonas sp.]